MTKPVALSRAVKVAHGTDIRYCIIGPDGAIDFHCSYPLAPNRIAGLEIHYRRRPTYMRERPADFENCLVIGGPCWCDGTSLYATEVLLPLFIDYMIRARDYTDEQNWWQTLEQEYLRRFSPWEVAFVSEETA